jgi:Hypothetical glycosyl hydrolase family 15/IPT/TIG domain
MRVADKDARHRSAGVKVAWASALSVSMGLAFLLNSGVAGVPQAHAIAHATLEVRVDPSAGTKSLTLPPTGRMLQRFAPTYMSKHTAMYSVTDAKLLAQNYDLIVGNSSQFTGGNIPAMKSANPNVRVLVYLNGSFDMFGNPNNGTNTYPLSEYALDATHKYIESTKYHNWLMNIGDPNWAGSVSLHCTQLLATAPYDGCFVDMLGDALLTGNYLTGQPINPATGAVWTTAQRMAATTLIGAAVTADPAHANKIIMGNGLNDGTRYFDSSAPTSQLLNGVNTALAETWLRQATMPIGKYRSSAVWQQEVNMLSDVGGKADFDAVTTKVWISATTAQITSWHRYALASFLLGTTGSSYFSFTQSQSSTEFQTDATSALDHTPTGAAVGPMQAASGGVFTREYVKAEVIVNPNKNSVAVSLPEACTTLDGVVVTPPTKLTMSGLSGQICSYGSVGPPPTVTAISPTGGPDTGGTSVQITGTGFTAGSAVSFGTNAATQVVFNSSTKITATSPAGFGTVDVTVANAAGTSSISSADQFTYAPPAVTGVLPNQGPAAGGTSVVITGTGFTGATVVNFGSNPASGVTVNSDTQITATSPAGTAGSVDVRVTTPDGTSAINGGDQFTYQPAPAVTGVSPANGPAAGGTIVVINGTGFTGATVVNFGSNPASGVTVNSDTQITATSPPGSGLVDVTVTAPDGTSAINSADQFTYAPVVSGIAPNSGPGGTTVTITGTGFTGAIVVDFGPNSATSFTVVSDTEITVTSPPGTPGPALDVTVTTLAGTSALNPATDQYTYQ